MASIKQEPGASAAQRASNSMLCALQLAAALLTAATVLPEGQKALWSGGASRCAGHLGGHYANLSKNRSHSARAALCKPAGGVGTVGEGKGREGRKEEVGKKKGGHVIEERVVERKRQEGGLGWRSKGRGRGMDGRREGWVKGKGRKR